MKQYIQKVIEKQDLTQGEMTEAFDLIMSGEATPSQIAGLIVALRMKGETVDEIAGGAASMRRHAVLVDPGGLPVVDTCGTGGDGVGTFNISTVVALVAAGAGLTVVKHGNRSVSSKCGSADVLETLGVKIDADPSVAEGAVNTIGVGFLFAPKFHSAMRYVMPTRRELGVRTMFNLLGPLANPANAKYQLVGIYDPTMLERYAGAMKRLGIERAMVVHGNDGLDEITTTATTQVAELADGEITRYEINPADYFNTLATSGDLLGGDAEENAAIARAILAGETGPKRNIVLLNAAAALRVAGKACDLTDGIARAADAIDSGAAMAKLDALIAYTQENG